MLTSITYKAVENYRKLSVDLQMSVNTYVKLWKKY